MDEGMKNEVRILGIESSCDETAAAVVADGRKILSSLVASQIDIHRKYGGVVPELASREHLRQIVPVVREAMAGAGLRFEELDGIGVTQGPGLVGSLLVGITYGKTLAQALGKPLLAVNHLEGHVRAAFLEAYQAGEEPKLPAVCLIVSGGHTVLYEVKVREEEEEQSTLRAQPLRISGQARVTGAHGVEASSRGSEPPQKAAPTTAETPRTQALRISGQAKMAVPREAVSGAGGEAGVAFEYRKLGGTRD